MPSFNLADQPWIPVYANGTTTTRSLGDVLNNAAHIDRIATGNHLEDAAIQHLLLAITLHSDGDTSTWLDDHRDQLDLFHPTQPFAQCAHLDVLGADTADAPDTLPYTFTTAHGSFNSYNTTSALPAGATLPTEEMARQLLVRQAFSVGGLLGPHTKKLGAPGRSANASTWTNHPSIWLHHQTLADSLAAMRDAATAANGPRGRFWFTTEERPYSHQEHNAGILDTLTLPTRAIRLYPTSDGSGVHGVHFWEGHRMAPADPDTWRTTTWEKKTAKGPWQPRKSHQSRPAWRQLLEAATPDQPGICNPAGLAPGATMSFTTLGSFQSRIDAILHGTVPTPGISADELAELAALVGKGGSLGTRIYATHGRAAHYAANSTPWEDSTGGDPDPLAQRYATTIERRIGQVAMKRIAGTITHGQAVDGLNQVVQWVRQRHLADLGAARPMAAAWLTSAYTYAQNKEQDNAQ